MHHLRLLAATLSLTMTAWFTRKGHASDGEALYAEALTEGLP